MLSPFGSILRGIEEGRFKRLDDRDDLWQVLAMLTVRKAINQRKRLTSLTGRAQRDTRRCGESCGNSWRRC